MSERSEGRESEPGPSGRGGGKKRADSPRGPAEGQEEARSIYDVSISSLDGRPADLHDYEDRAILLVNVASQCGLTPQYTGLEEIHERFVDRGFTVLGVPCNQFGAQSPGPPRGIRRS